MGTEYIIMEKASGVELSEVWDNMIPQDKATLAKQLAEITTRLANTKFAYYGSLYYQRDISPDESK